eukprot:106030_1
MFLNLEDAFTVDASFSDEGEKESFIELDRLCDDRDESPNFEALDKSSFIKEDKLSSIHKDESLFNEKDKLPSPSPSQFSDDKYFVVVSSLLLSLQLLSLFNMLFVIRTLQSNIYDISSEIEKFESCTSLLTSETSTEDLDISSSITPS